MPEFSQIIIDMMDLVYYPILILQTNKHISDCKENLYYNVQFK